MLLTLHWLTLIFYWTAPIVAAAIAVAHGNRRQGQSIVTYLTALVAGAMLGTSLTVMHARDVQGRASVGQFLLAIYFATGLMLALRLIHGLLKLAIDGKHPATAGKRAVASAVIRGVALIVIGLPYVVSAVTIYRPKALPLTDPMAELRFRYTPVQFEATDGMHLAGWWIPAMPARQPSSLGAPGVRSRTVIICHGWGENKGTHLLLSRRLVPAGYNVLIFDFRAHGESGGQFSTLGDLERRDVLGAVRWLQQTHPQQAEQIFGLGAGTGAAALIAAAADKSHEGQSIEAVAVYGAYDDLASLSKTLARASFASPMDWITSRLGLAMASIQTGAALGSFSPATLVHDLWPRPILVIHATYDLEIPFDHGRRLFDAASYPKQPLWLTQEFGDEALRDDAAANTVREFFENARPIPEI